MSETIAVARGMPPIPIGSYSSASSPAFTTRLPSAMNVGVQGRCRLKNVRIRIRLIPANGSESAKKNRASETRSVWAASNSPRW